MKRVAFLSFAFITMITFSACHKNATGPSVQTLILGKWTLQKQTYVQYVNDVKQVDTVCLASDTTAANVQFNADKSYKSEGKYLSKDLNNPSNAETDVSGTYTASNSSVTVSNTMAGFLFFEAVYTLATNYNINTAITNPLHTSKLNAITSNSLSIHTEDSYTATTNSVSTTYKMINDFYYTK